MGKTLLDLLNTQMQNAQQQSGNVAARDQQALKTLTRKQAITKDASLATQKIANDSMATGIKSRQAQLSVLGGEEEAVKIAKEAMALSDSGNPLDKVTLWLKQQGNPLYTRQGSIKRIDYLRKARATMAVRGNIAQAGNVAKLDALKQDVLRKMANSTDLLDLSNAQVQIGKNSIDSAQLLVDAKTNQITESNKLKEQALSGLDRVQLGSRIQEAVNQGISNVTIAPGVTVPTNEANQRLSILEQRFATQTISKSNAQKTSLWDMTDSALQTTLANSKDGMAKMPDGTDVSSYLVREVIDNKNRGDAKYALGIAADKNARDLVMQQTVKSFTATETQQAIANGGVFDGIPYDIPTLQKHAGDLNQSATTQAAFALGQAQSSTPEYAMSQTSSYLDSLLQNKNISEPLKQVLEQQKAALAKAASLISTMKDPLNKQTAAEVLSQATRKAADTAITNEATRLSNGNDLLTQAITAQLKGLPVPIAVVTSLLEQGMTKGTGVSSLLPRKLAVLFNNTYMATLQKFTSSGSAAPNKVKQAQAFQAAMNAISTSAAESLLPTILGMEVSQGDTGWNNPLKGQVSPEQLISYFDRATETGSKRYMDTTGLTKEQIAADPKKQYAENVAQMADFLMAIEADHPGGAKALADWWNSTDRMNFGGTVGPALAKYASNSPQEHMSASIANSQIPALLTTVNRALQDGYRELNAVAIETQRKNFLTFGGDQYRRQIFLLSNSKDLTDAERKDALNKLIIPLIKIIHTENKNNTNYKVPDLAAQNSTFEERLNNLPLNDPALIRLRAKVIKGQSGVLDLLNKLVNDPSNKQSPYQTLNPTAGPNPVMSSLFTPAWASEGK